MRRLLSIFFTRHALLSSYFKFYSLHSTFYLMLGHERTISLLKQLAADGELAQGYVFHGSSGAGRKMAAVCLANYLENGSFSEPAGTLSDLSIIAPPPGGSIGIDEVRALKQAIYQAPVRARRRTLILDDADSLTEEAENALLKIAEEPPATGLLIVVVRDPGSLMATLRSRLQALFFGPISDGQLAEWLEKDRGLRPEEAHQLARRSGGLPGVAVRLASDPEFQVRISHAEEMLNLRGEERRAMIKELLEPENFSLGTFLDDVCLVLAARLRDKGVAKERELWHNLMELRKNASYFPLNPRLQLEALFFNY